MPHTVTLELSDEEMTELTRARSTRKAYGPIEAIRVLIQSSMQRTASTTATLVKHPRRRKNTPQVFWRKVKKIKGGCWEWQGGPRVGYGSTYYQGKLIPAHRLAWILAKGPIPDGLFILHDCPGGDNPRCCNPKHLRPGTHQENMQDLKRKGPSPRSQRRGAA